MPSSTAKGDILLQWEKLSALPLGGMIFDKLIGFKVPYTGTISPHVERLGIGKATISIREHRIIRNHLNCVHAIALMNLGELAGNLAVMTAQPKGTRWIVTKMQMEYLKKARGKITAESHAPDIDWTQVGEVTGVTELKDEAGDVVARSFATIKIDPAKG